MAVILDVVIIPVAQAQKELRRLERQKQDELARLAAGRVELQKLLDNGLDPTSQEYLNYKKELVSTNTLENIQQDEAKAQTDLKNSIDYAQANGDTTTLLPNQNPGGLPAPAQTVDANNINATATSTVTVTPVSTVPLPQVRTNAVGLPAATLVEEAGLDIQNNNPIGPDPFAEENAPPAPIARETPVPTYRAEYNAIQDSWSVVNANTGQVLTSGLTTEEQANALIVDENAPTPNIPQPQVAAPNPYPGGLPFDSDTGLLNPGFTLNERNEPVFVGFDFVEPATQASAAQSRIEAQTREAQRQQTYINQQRQINNQDWRLRLSLAPQSNYLYNVPDAGILDPLKPSNGVIFPYTPQISTSYKANYSPTDLTHSNYRGYFYQNSYTDSVTVTATFTAQNTREANYLLAVIHFFRSVTKMFYGQSQNLGSPPPICYLNGLGEYQFNKHPVVVSQFNYTLPSDVDYIRAGSSNNLQLNQNPLRDKQATTTNSGLNSVLRLANAFLKPGASRDLRPPTSTLTRVNSPTYVPTKMEIVITLLPMQSRTQVSQQFNLQTFANGQQLKGGFW
jgi:hypothetical protein